MKRFGSDLERSRSSRAVIFPFAVGPNVFFLGASLLDEEVSLLIIMELVRQKRSVKDVAEKTIEFRTFQNAKVPLEVVAGHLTLDLKPNALLHFRNS